MASSLSKAASLLKQLSMNGNNILISSEVTTKQQKQDVIKPTQRFHGRQAGLKISRRSIGFSLQAVALLGLPHPSLAQQPESEGAADLPVQQDVEEASGPEGLGPVYVSTEKKYSFKPPLEWEQQNKIQSDVTFVDKKVAKRILGLNIQNVRVKSLDDFGSLDKAAKGILSQEKRMDGVINVTMKNSEKRTLPSGATAYVFEYYIENIPRGDSKVLSIVTIANGQLYALTGTAKCGKQPCTPAVDEAIQLYYKVINTFDVQT